LFQVLFNHQQGRETGPRQLAGLSVEPVGTFERAAQFELALHTTELADGTIQASFVYAAELFERASMERLAGHFVAMVTALAQAPETAVGDVGLMSEAEWAALERLSLNAATVAPMVPVHRLIERQAAAAPEAPALVFGAETLTRAALNRCANRLARRLMGLGVGPDTRVGLAVERSLEMMVGVLAILKAGGAYVPLDPELPADRLGYMLDDSGVSLVLTQSHLRGRLPEGAGRLFIDIDGCTGVERGASASNGNGNGLAVVTGSVGTDPCTWRDTACDGRLATNVSDDENPQVELHGEHL
ncbi:AMP-binding protein, partial [Klebsiella pneumoniae]|nr:AMP-binding protein [Klebsiella pneumoniae]